MEKKAIELLGVVFRMLLRYWTKDSKVFNANIVDAEQFAQQCGLSIWEAKKFNRSVEDFVDVIAEDFIKEFGNGIEDENRRDAIFSQIQKDVERINLNERKIISELSNPEELRNLIMAQSENERRTWSDTEVGVYTNCVRYVSKAGIDFVSKLPSFTPEALKVVIQRQKEYQNELLEILTDIHAMTSLMKGVDVTYREYESIYREKILEKYNKVELIGSGITNRNITRYDISSAYVELSCISEENYGYEIELSKVFANHNVVWVKGEAGSGKTTFLQWVAVCAAKNEYEKIENIENTIPIVISLRNTEWPISLQNVVNKITAIYGSNCPDGWILELLRKNRAILLFDGLDEISRTKREETYNFIEDIITQYPRIKILLTSRNSVNDSINCENIECEIIPMTMENIKKFISYWHTSVLRKDAVVQDEEIERLQNNLKQKIVENPSLKVLARNPLLCAMICALNFINNERMPENKMELYEKCCEMLMDARDAQRSIDDSIYKNVPKFDYTKKRKILEEIAYWMMNGGVSSDSRSNVEGYLEHLIKDINILIDKNREYSAKEILDFFVERSGIIREPEKGVIDFIHKTFMEFLAVKTICRNCNWNVLVREACNVNWKETIIMCFREMGKENAEYVLKQLLNKGRNLKDDRYFLIASLGAANAVFISDNVIKEEIDSKIKEMIPPHDIQKIYDLKNAGTYILPFLKDSKEYSWSEKSNCLFLLRLLETEEAIPVALSYLTNDMDWFIESDVSDILCRYKKSILNEYNVIEQVIKMKADSIRENYLSISENTINLISNEKNLVQYRERFKEVKRLLLSFSDLSESLYADSTEALTYLRQCEEVKIVGGLRGLDFLQNFTNIISLEIVAAYDLTEIIPQFSYFRNLISVKSLYINTDVLYYFCIKDLYVFENLETFELQCDDKRLKLDIINFDKFTKLRKVVISVNESLRDHVKREIPIWKSNRDDLEIICHYTKK